MDGAVRIKLLLLLHCCRVLGASWGPSPGGVIPVLAAVMKKEELHELCTAFSIGICSGLHASSLCCTCPLGLCWPWSGFLGWAGVSCKGAGKWGGKQLWGEAGTSSLLDGEDLGAKTALGGLEVWISF